MRSSFNWRLIFKTIGMAFVLPGRQLKVDFQSDADTQTGQQESNPVRAFMLAFGHPVVDELLARKVRAAQIASIARLTPFIVLANVVNVIVITLAFQHFMPFSFIAVWIAAIGAFLAYTLFKWLKANRSPIHLASRRSLNKAVLHATIFSGLWAVVPIAAFGYGDPDGIWIASCVTTGMLCGGGFTLATVPQAAFRWVAILFLASLVSFAIGRSAELWPLVFLLSSYTLVVVGSVASAGWLFASHFLAEAELEQRGELIALLLNEFEEKSSDWLWKSDSHGNLHSISDRFLHASGRDRAELETMRMVDLAYSLDENDARSAVTRLENAMKRQQAFR
ncbi:MAG: bifunctional diguanylate cyclase/phosphodiesterase, partial [Pseudomonadota bacterium]|nr:bifunctional diguanylate cyclase/phosphodiesterase [Pseudomonadota bacterium]